MNETQIENVKREFKDTVQILMVLVEYQEKFNDIFLKVKLALVAFAGVILTIIINNPQRFSSSFLLTLLLITLLIFLLLVIELKFKLWNLYRTLKGQDKRTKLAKMRHIAAIDDLPEYGKAAEKIIIGDDDMRQAMRGQKVPSEEFVNELIKYKEDIFWKINFYFWAGLFISIPILFLLLFLGII